MKTCSTDCLPDGLRRDLLSSDEKLFVDDYDGALQTIEEEEQRKETKKKKAVAKVKVPVVESNGHNSVSKGKQLICRKIVKKK